MKKTPRTIIDAFLRSNPKHSAAHAAHASHGRHAAHKVRATLSKHPAQPSNSVRALLRQHSRLVAGIVIAAVLAFFGIYSCATNPGQLPNDQFAFNKTYDWTDLYNNDGRYSYVENGQEKSRIGIDVSEHQHFIDWEAVANDGIDFAFIRVGNRGTSEGVIQADEYFTYNIDAASQAGLDVGVYFFSQSINEAEAREEAEYVLEQIKGKKVSYPIVYDHEPIAGVSSRADGLSVEQMTKNAQAFCETINEAGYNAMIYGNSRDLSRYDMSQVSSWGIWLARYGSSVPDWNSGFSIWQYTNSGSVKGIDTAVDINIHFLP